MSDTYTKLFSSITASTIWQEPAATRLVWITMLAMCDKSGHVYASVPGLAHIANVSLPECEIALTTLLSPDKYSRTPSFEGRRIEPIDGGWQLLNHAKFRAIRSAEERREYMREYMAKQRAKKPEQLADSLAGLADLADVTPPAPAPAPEDQKISTSKEVDGETPVSPCPITEIVNLYHKLLPNNPKVYKITKKRRGYIQQRWREDLGTLDEWHNYFEFVSRSRFLTGKTSGTDGRPPFVAGIDWLTNPENFTKISEEKYHRA